MNYEEIIERLLDEKHITAKEAIYLLRLCDKRDTNIPYYPFTDPKPIPTVGDSITQPRITWITKSSEKPSVDPTDVINEYLNNPENLKIKTSPCMFCNMRNVSYYGDSPCKNCTKEGRDYLFTIATNKENENISITAN